MIVKIEKMDHFGRGIAYVDGKITFIPNALPEEIIEIIITDRKKKYNIGKCVKIIKQSKDRIEAVCPYFNECGGCDLMHMTYIKELNYKCDKVKEILKKYANIETNLKIIESENREFYRNKITLHYNGVTLGYMKKNSNEIIKISECKIADKNINTYIKSLDNVNKDLIIRTDTSGNIISSIKENKMLMKVKNFIFQIDINSFFQINNNILEKIFDYIYKSINESGISLDLYSGVGTLSILISKKSKKVYGIEVNEFSYKNALKNLELNKINNVEFLCGKVENKISEIKGKVDLIVIDPPRNGMDEITIKTIKEKLPKQIVYMSCEPMTLARDLKALKESYEIKEITLFDMFPYTRHVECVSLLSLKVLEK